MVLGTKRKLLTVVTPNCHRDRSGTSTRSSSLDARDQYPEMSNPHSIGPSGARSESDQIIYLHGLISIAMGLFVEKNRLCDGVPRWTDDACMSMADTQQPTRSALTHAKPDCTVISVQCVL